MSGNQLRDNDVISILDSLTFSCSTITHLDFSDNLITDIGGLTIASFIICAEKLTHVNLADNNLTFRSCISLFQNMEDSACFSLMNCMRNDISHKDCQQMFDRMERKSKKHIRERSSFSHQLSPCIIFSPKIDSLDNKELTTIVYRFPYDFPSPDSVEDDELIHIFTGHQNRKMRKQSVNYYHSELDLEAIGWKGDSRSTNTPRRLKEPKDTNENVSSKEKEALKTYTHSVRQTAIEKKVVGETKDKLRKATPKKRTVDKKSVKVEKDEEEPPQEPVLQRPTILKAFSDRKRELVQSLSRDAEAQDNTQQSSSNMFTSLMGKNRSELPPDNNVPAHENRSASLFSALGRKMS